jgi:N-acetylglucosaminyl-diphospho-decaprenol L-rhamnosyltransferase
MPELSIIIVHYHTQELLRLCLDSIKKTAYGIKYELIVVDSAAIRETRDMIEEKYPEIIFVPFKENLGYSRGVNIGIQKSKGKYLLVLNPDIITTKGAILKMLWYVKKHPDIAVVGPKMMNFNGLPQKTFFSFYKPATIMARRSFLGKIWPFKKPFKKMLDEFLMADADDSKIQTPDWVMGSAMMLNREAISKVGGMDERFFMYFEDVDWCRRFWHNGYKVVFYPEAVMFHYYQRESKSRLGIFDALFNQKTRWHIKSAIRFFWKYRNLTQKYV